MKDLRTRAQRWADRVTEFSGSWTFIVCFTAVCLIWIAWNMVKADGFDPYPFLFLNWVLTVVSTFQNPLIMLSQNRQNENDRANMAEVLAKLDALQKTVDELKKAS